MQGYFITFEGLDGAGKSTQITFLNDFLSKEKGLATVCTREPGGHKIAEDIRSYLLANAEHCEGYRDLLLFSAARLLNVETVILPALRAGKIVLCDRFIDSSWVYQVKEHELDEAFARFLEKIVCRNIMPDLTFILDLPEEDALARIEKRCKIDNQKKEYFEKETLSIVRQRRANFLLQAKDYPERYHIINAGLKAEEIAQQIQNIVSQTLKF